MTTPSDALQLAVLENGRSLEHWPFPVLLDAVARIATAPAQHWLTAARDEVRAESKRRAQVSFGA